MICQWQSLIKILPTWMRTPVDKHGKNTLQELRMRLNMPPELICADGNIWLEQTVLSEDIRFCINVASQYSPWSVSTVKNGFITVCGGHRIGICGTFVLDNGKIISINTPNSLCIRVARDYTGISKDLASHSGSMLIIGPPGSGKTTLLRDIIRSRSNLKNGNITVIDERGEIFPYHQNQMCFPTGRRTDIISGCSKTQGIEMALRNMGPELIAVDEITANEDCTALIRAGWCGVDLMATAHASSKEDLLSRPVYQPIVASRLFDTLITLHRDKSWRAERMDK